MKTEQKIINLQHQIIIWKSKISDYQSMIEGAQLRIEKLEEIQKNEEFLQNQNLEKIDFLKNEENQIQKETETE